MGYDASVLLTACRFFGLAVSVDVADEESGENQQNDKTSLHVQSQTRQKLISTYETLVETNVGIARERVAKFTTTRRDVGAAPR